MSSSAALFFPRSRPFVASSPADSASSAAFPSAAGSRRADLANNVESEFAFLESKPSLVDDRAGKGRTGGGNKGRRHAGEAVLRRKLANQAFLVRIGGPGGMGGSKSGGGGAEKERRTGRGKRGGVLAELVADQFAPSVPYSLNRKCRWSKDGAEWLRELAQGWADGGQKRRIKMSLTEAEYSLGGGGTEWVRAWHGMDSKRAEREGGGGGGMESRWARSARGAVMAAGLANRGKEEKERDETGGEGEEGEEEENREPGGAEDSPPMAVHFQLTRPHAVPRLFAGKFFKRKQLRAGKRSGGMEMASSSSSSSLVSSGGRPRPIERLMKPAAMESEAEEETDGPLAAQYRPRRDTYSLADFLKCAIGPAGAMPCATAIRRRMPNSGGAAGSAAAAKSGLGGIADPIEEDQFAIVPEMECVVLPDEEDPTTAAANLARCPSRPAALARSPSSSSSPFALQLRRLILAPDSACPPVGFFRQFPLALAISDQSHLRDLARQRPEWHPKMLGDHVLALDMSWAITKQQQPDKQWIVMILSPGELLVNSIVPLNEQKVANALANAEGGLEQKIGAIMATVRADFAEWELGRQRAKEGASVATGQLESMRAIFHSERLAPPVQPLSVYAIIGQQGAELAREEQDSQFVGEEELLAKGEKREEEGEEEEEGFEVIEMTELCSATGGERRPQRGGGGVREGQCAECAKPGPALAAIPSCGHQLCWDCLSAAVGQQMKAAAATTPPSTDQAGHATALHCPLCPAALVSHPAAPLPFGLLAWLLPLSTANSLALLHHAEHGGGQLVQCPGCQAILKLPGRQLAECGGAQLGCARCALHWCTKCGLAPHWPLNCAQNGEWMRKTGRHTGGGGEGASQHVVPGGSDKLAPRAGGNGGGGAQIGGQFGEVCAEARLRRMDTRLGWQLGKHMRRLVDSRAERRFLTARKTALHLLEFGTAWLYLHRQQRPPAWAQLKSHLWALRERVECLDNELLFSGSLTDPDTLKAKLADLEQMGEKMTTKFGMAMAGGGAGGGQ